MKKIFLPLTGITIVFSFLFLTAFTGKKELPRNISLNISSRYPDARVKGWEKRDDRYIVKVREDKNKCVLYYSDNGQWIKTEKHIALTKDLPPAVKQSFDKGPYASWHVNSIDEVTSDNEQPLYMLHIDDGDQLDSWHYDAMKSDYNIYFSRDGVLQKKTPYKVTYKLTQKV